MEENRVILFANLPYRRGSSEDVLDFCAGGEGRVGFGVVGELWEGLGGVRVGRVGSGAGSGDDELVGRVEDLICVGKRRV